MKFFELHPKPEYKHPFYESYKKEFKNMKQKSQLKREQMQKRLDARDEYVEKVVKDLNSKVSWRKAANKKQDEFKDRLENKKLYHYKWMQKQK